MCIRDRCKPTSIQSPSIFNEGIVTQSPSLIVSDPKTWIEATSPKIVSLKTNNNIAVKAPKPESIVQGEVFD